MGLTLPVKCSKSAVSRSAPNKRIEFVRCAHPTRNGEAPLLAAHSRR